MRRLASISLLALFAATAASAANDPAGDKAMHDYVLTMPKVKAYDAAANAAEAAIKKDASLKAEVDNTGTEPDQTIAQIRAKFDHHPKIYAFYAAQGLSKDEATLLPLALLGACSAAQYPQIAAKMAATVSADQIAFCKAHLPELQKMKFFAGGDD